MQFNTIYDFSTAIYPLTQLILPFCFIIFCIILLIINWKKSIYYKIIASIMLLLNLLILLQKYYDKKEFEALKSSLINNQCDIIDGYVEKFHPMPQTGHDVESFYIKEKYFEYTGSDLRYGFHQPAVFGGPIKEGLYVKIYSKDGIILKIANEKVISNS